MEHNNSKISQLVKENIKFLKTLAFTNSERKKKKLLKKATREQLLSIAEIFINIVKSRFKLTTRQRKRLIPHADFVRRLSRARSERGARKILKQGQWSGLIIRSSINSYNYRSRAIFTK